MGIDPTQATSRALERVGLTLADMDIIECNKAFAAQTLAVMKELAEKAGAHVPEMSGRAKIPTGIPGSQPKLPHPR